MVTPARTYYISGPMRGRPEFNYPAFFALERDLHALGHNTINPARQDEGHGGAPVAGLKGDEQWFMDQLHDGQGLAGALLADYTAILQEASGVVVLDEWWESKGARSEVFVALAVGVPVYVMAYGRLRQLSLKVDVHMTYAPDENRGKPV